MIGKKNISRPQEEERKTNDVWRKKKKDKSYITNMYTYFTNIILIFNLKHNLLDITDYVIIDTILFFYHDE